MKKTIYQTLSTRNLTGFGCLYILLFLASQIHAQNINNSVLQFIYPLNEQESEYFALHNELSPELEAQIQSKGIPFPIHWSTDSLVELQPLGAYLSVIPKGPRQIDYKLYFQTDLEIYMLDSHQGKQVFIQQKGEYLTAKDGVEVYYKGKTVKPKDKGFVLKKYKSYTPLKVKFEGQVVWMEMRSKRLAAQKNHYDRWKWHRFKKIKERRNKKRYKKMHWGYIALNQAVYRPLDTVRVQAYFSSIKKGTLDEPISIEVQRTNASYYEKNIIETTLRPSSSGFYEFKFALDDSLKIDQYYDISFRKGYRKMSTTFFKIEDYELKDFTFTFSPDSTFYQDGKDITFKANALYSTGERVPSANIKLTITSENVENFFEDTLIIPDIIWEHNLNLLYTDETHISIPDSLVPNAKMALSYKAICTANDGEKRVKEGLLFINNDKAHSPLSLNIKNGYWVGKWKDKKDFKDSIGWLIYEYPNDYIKEYIKVKLPFQEKIPFDIESATLSVGKYNTGINLSSYENPVSSSFERGIDSIKITLSNPSGVLVYYMILKGKQKIEDGFTNEKVLQWNRKEDITANYGIAYSYPWRGTTIYDYEIWNYAHQDLLLSIKHPQSIAPGENMPITLKLTDGEGQAVPNAQISTAAISSKLDAPLYQSYQLPNLINEQKPLVDFDKPAKAYTRNVSASDTKYEYELDEIKRFQLYKEQKYKVHFPKDSLYIQRNTLTDTSFALCSPFVVKKGAIQAVAAIYCDREPVFYADCHNEAYFFNASEGYHNITIRTNRGFYHVDSVLLKKGEHVIISLDADFWEAEAKKGISNNLFEFNPEFWTYQETWGRKQTIFSLKTQAEEQYAVWQENGIVNNIFNNSYDIINFGPFTQNKSIHLIKQYDFEKELAFEVGFIYDVDKIRERLYSHDLHPDSDKEPQALSLYYPKFEDVKTDFLKTGNNKKFIPRPLYFDQLNSIDDENDYINASSIKFKWDEHQYHNRFALLLILKNNQIIRISQDLNLIENLPKGNLNAIYLTVDGYATFNIPTKQLATTYINLEKLNLIKADTDNFVKQLLLQQEALGDIEVPELLNDNPDIPNKSTIKVGFGRIITGKVRDDLGDEVIGANVYIKENSALGTVTDFDGSFSLEAPNTATTLVINYTGYPDVEVDLTGGGSNFENIVLTSGVLLMETVVVGYGSNRRRDKENDDVFTGSRYVEPMKDLNEVKRRIDIDEIVSKVDAGNASVPFLAAMSPDYKRLYIVDGVITSGEHARQINRNLIQSIKVLEGEAAIATYGREALNGVILISTNGKIERPNNLRENFRDYAFFEHTRTNENGEATIQTQLPDDISGWEVYAIGMDEKVRVGVAQSQFSTLKAVLAELRIPRFSLQGDSIDIVGRSLNYTEDSLQARTAFGMNDEIIASNAFTLSDYQFENQPIQVPFEQDSFKLSYQVFANDVSDGEERKIPILQVGTTETKGIFKVLQAQDSIQYQKVWEDEPLALFITDNSWDLLLEDAKRLQDYRHGCMEQTASKLIALLLEKEINNKIGKAFKKDASIKKMMSRLAKNQNPNGSWGWWPGNEGADWVTLHVMEALLMAKEQKFKKEDVLGKGLSYLANRSNEMTIAHQLHAYQLIQKGGTPLQLDDVSALDTMDLHLSEYLLYQQLRQQMGLEIDTNEIQQLLQPNLRGGLYVQEKEERYWYYSNMQSNLIAFDILEQADLSEQLDSLSTYLIYQRNQNGWANTIQSAQVLKRLLRKSSPPAENQAILLNGKRITDFPHQVNIDSDKAIHVKHLSDATLFLSASQQKHNPKPKANEDWCVIRSEWVQNGQTTALLQKNEDTQLNVNIQVKKAGEYVMIEVPLPAGCIHAENRQMKQYWFENQREHFKEKVVIYCSKLDVGDYTFSINLNPQFTGRYRLNPARMEEMYAPVHYGHNEVKQVLVE